jgi:hypothetical protein
MGLIVVWIIHTHRVRDLNIQKTNLNNEMTNLLARITNLEKLFDAKQSKIDKVIKEKVDSIVHDEELIFSMSFLALIEALRNHPNIKLLLRSDYVSRYCRRLRIYKKVLSRETEV